MLHFENLRGSESVALRSGKSMGQEGAAPRSERLRGRGSAVLHSEKLIGPGSVWHRPEKRKGRWSATRPYANRRGDKRLCQQREGKVLGRALTPDCPTCAKPYQHTLSRSDLIIKPNLRVKFSTRSLRQCPISATSMIAGSALSPSSPAPSARR